MNARSVAGLCLAVATGAGVVSAQAPTPAQPPASFPTTFEVVSVKPNRSGDDGISIRRQPGGRFSTVNAPLRSLITLAYQIQGFQLGDVPDWVNTERWDIVARMDADPPPMPPGTPNDPMILAVRALLADRFRLSAHRETQERDIYALVMARPDGKPGPALKPTAQDCPKLQEAARAGGAPPAAAGGAPPAVMCGVRQTFGRVIFAGSPLSMFTGGLAGQVGRVVVDRTGLTGGWDFELTFTPDRGLAQPGAEPPPVEANAPSLFTAIEEQLGLKLQATKGPIDVVVVDRVERPTPD
jgi:uncharacterized protein (TIGR03435 family)